MTGTFFSRLPILEEMDASILQGLEEKVTIKSYSVGELVIIEGDEAEGVFFIQEGRVKVYKLSLDGGQTVLNVFGRGDVFAEAILFSDNEYPATVEVIEDATIGKLSIQSFENFILTNPEVALQMIKVLGERLVFAQRQVHRLVQQDTITRTAALLALLVERYGQRTSKGVELTLSITREELAQFVGTTRETVSRVLSQLRKNAIITTDNRSITILDLRKLKDLGS